ncbi:hypothetical protein CPU12_11360 [Malaciobacter molluscorum LMG 25693]|uniref:Uncharacterized protein n=1 Tax=Malaciobacter molluscorum LMG 25693 TaxID=870501 RepID=A0A2G1DFN6_9BACT|nr:hypothetical protein [Malaciobacter molluscorum]AXX93546.1 hypothetical protein AMOL_2607 [Malaciobacter molluscorum LMG 25693]PHO17299.1 hypothetical protein CPU12_11360 [Malaciobacter molluscorum LMG 25693]
MNLDKKIKLFSYDAGGANLVMAYAYFMDKKGYKVFCYPKGPALKTFQKHIPYLICNEKVVLENSDIVVIGTSGIHSDYEIEILIEAKKIGLEVRCFLDSSLNLEKRFSFNNKPLDNIYLPDVIYCEEVENIKDKNIKEKVHFKKDLYLKYIKDIFYPQLIIKDKLILENKNKYILFLSEYIKELYGNKFGFNEYDVLELILSCMNKEKITIPIFIKLHPAEKKSKFDYIIKQYKNLNIFIKEFDIHEVIYGCKCIFGINSSVFKESMLLNINTYSIQLLKNINVLDGVKVINSEEKLKKILRKLDE